jgi:hypothetical protein
MTTEGSGVRWHARFLENVPIFDHEPNIYLRIGTWGDLNIHRVIPALRGNIHANGREGGEKPRIFFHDNIRQVNIQRWCLAAVSEKHCDLTQSRRAPWFSHWFSHSDAF